MPAKTVRKRFGRNQAADRPARRPIPVSNKKLIALAKKNPPPQTWFEETDLPFVPVRRKPRDARAA